MGLSGIEGFGALVACGRGRSALRTLGWVGAGSLGDKMVTDELVAERIEWLASVFEPRDSCLK